MEDADIDESAILAATGAMIAASPLFDDGFYNAQTGIARSRDEAIAHYLAEGERAGVKPSAFFDPDHYFLTYPDVHEGGVNALGHYLSHGRVEGRHATVARGRRRHLRRLAGAGYRPEDYLRLEPVFDRAHYRAQQPNLPPDADPLHDYLAYGRWAGLSGAPDFNHLYYVSRYPDLDPATYEPLLHFLDHGRGEGRVGRPDFSARLRPGRIPHDPARETILVVNHEASRTGAPLVALALARHLAETRNVIVATGRTGSMEGAFAEIAVATVAGTIDADDAPCLLAALKQEYGLAIVLLSSAETSVVAPAALVADIPSVGLVHEFAEYSFGRVGEMIATVDVAIVPTGLVLASAQAEMLRDYGGAANNIVVQPQGILPKAPLARSDLDLTAEEIHALIGANASPRPKIVLGGGFVHIRKGLDLFVQTAAEMVAMGEHDMRFVWVGEGYHPKRDPHYSLWMADLIVRLGLSDKLFVVGPQSSLDIFYDVADIFFLSSRLDPFPNVAIDAFAHGKPVVCFSGGTGIAEWIESGRAAGAAVRLGDTRAAAGQIGRLLGEGRAPGVANAAFAREAFDFGHYCDVIDAQIARARQKRDAQHIAVERLREGGLFDPVAFDVDCDLPLAADAPLKYYVAQASKGLNRSNPRPGFNDLLYRARADMDAGDPAVPLDHAARADEPSPPATHRCVTIAAVAPGGAGQPKAAIVLKDPGPASAAIFAGRLARSGSRADLTVSIGPGGSVERMQALFAGRGGGTVEVRRSLGPDRDLALLLDMLTRGDGPDGPDVIGLIDLAGYGDASGNVSPNQDAAARAVGNPAGVSGDISGLLRLFGEDPTLGLVFAEDGHASAFGMTAATAERVSGLVDPKMWPAPTIRPPGETFWARSEAIAPLRRLASAIRSDGGGVIPGAESVRRTILAMLVPACEAAGYRWMTVR